MTSIMNILATYGFETRGTHLWWGVGSLVWGYIAEVKSLGEDLYEVHYREWFYDSWGECLKDEDTTVVLHGGEALGYLFTRLPIFSDYRPNRRR